MHYFKRTEKSNYNLLSTYYIPFNICILTYYHIEASKQFFLDDIAIG